MLAVASLLGEFVAVRARLLHDVALSPPAEGGKEDMTLLCLATVITMQPLESLARVPGNFGLFVPCSCGLVDRNEELSSPVSFFFLEYNRALRTERRS